MNSALNMKYLGMAFMVIGILVALFGIKNVMEHSQFQKNGDVITAVVSRVEDESTLSGAHKARLSKMYVDYTYNGTEYHDVYAYSSGTGDKVGYEVRIIVDRTNPNNIVAENKNNSDIGGGLLVMLGAIFGMAGFITYRYYVNQ